MSPEFARAALGGFLAMKPKFNLQIGKVFESNDVALLHSKWTLNGTGPDGTPVALSGQTSDVVRRQKDGGWLMVIDNPWGVG